MRNISFSFTTEQFRARTKTVTRRMGWKNLKRGELLCGVEKCMGLKRGEQVKRLAVIRILSVERQGLSEIVHRWQPGPAPFRYGPEECVKEGFTTMSPREFQAMFCKTHLGCTPATEITRIEFEYMEDG